MMRRLGLRVLVLLFAAPPTLAQDPIGEPALGREMAQALCVDCHFVDVDQTAPRRSIAPSFYVLAEDPAVTEFRLRMFLIQTPHPVMPNFIFTDREADDLAAYILSLRE